MNSSDSEEKLHQISEMKQHLSQIKDVDILLENILSSARKIVHADAGSIYEYDEQRNRLKIRYSQNDTQLKKLSRGEKLPYISYSFTATTKFISGYSVLHKTAVNIPDVYNMPPFLDEAQTVVRPYDFSKENDIKTGYHTKSMLTIPLVMTTGKVLGALQIINAQDEDGNAIPFGKDDEFYISYFASNVIQVYEYAYLTKQLIERLVKMANYRDPRETGAHVERVSYFALEIYDRYAVNRQIPEDVRNKFRDNLKLAAKCHDIGKIGVPDKILKKAGLLDESERNIMKGHTCVGAQIFTPSENELDAMARDVCLHHHDRWDGGSFGYPGKFDYESYVAETEVPSGFEPIRGEEIPLAARIVALSDVYDALRHRRCYKESWTVDDTINEIRKESGRQFDPELVDAFLQVVNRLEAINRDFI